jgi:hypothetical protein
MTNSTLLTADRMTHLKIVVVSLVCATLIAGLGIAGRLSDGVDGRNEGTVIKAARPLTAATGTDRTIR